MACAERTFNPGCTVRTSLRESYRVGRDVRVRTLDVPRDRASRSGLHLVVRHGLGSAIAYDALTAVDGAPQVDALLTVGRPLGICGVQDKLSPP